MPLSALTPTQTQICRNYSWQWGAIHLCVFIGAITSRYGKDQAPELGVFVCEADLPILEQHQGDSGNPKAIGSYEEWIGAV